MKTQDLAVSVHRLTKRYGHTEVLKDVNIEIEKGSIYCLLGSNGAGKTTTIKILTTLAAFDSGEVSVCAHSVAAEGDAVRKLISLTGQFASVDEKLSGYENLVMIGKLNHLKTPKQKAKELLEYFSLTEAANRMVGTYSGGMRRKLDIAMSLVGNPQIIFLDEPTTGLDPQSRHSMWSIIKQLNSMGITIFLTTQYLEEAEQLADHIAILDQGRILTEGTPAELKKLLPQGIVEFEFPDSNMLETAMAYTADYTTKPVVEEHKLIIYTDGSAEALFKLFQIFSSSDIKIQKFYQKLPNLEDVFLTLVHEREDVR